MIDLELPLVESWFVLNLALGKKIRTDMKLKVKPNRNLVSLLGYLCYMVSESLPPYLLKLLVFQIFLTAKVLDLVKLQDLVYSSIG
jgi:hypothetical protein